MPHYLMNRLRFPLELEDPIWVQECYHQIKHELEQSVRTFGGFGSPSDRLDRLELFTLLDAAHTRNIVIGKLK